MSEIANIFLLIGSYQVAAMLNKNSPQGQVNSTNANFQRRQMCSF